MTARVAEILIPLALDQTYSYAVPDDLSLAEGDLVAVPLGPRERLGVVWALRPGAGDNFKKVAGKYDAPAMPASLRRLVDWLAWYTLAPKGSALGLALKVPTPTGPGSGTCHRRLGGHRRWRVRWRAERARNALRPWPAPARARRQGGRLPELGDSLVC